MRQRHYQPFRVVISFLLLGILEERSLLSFLSPWGPMTEVGGGLCLFIIIIIIYPCAPCSRIYPPVSTIVSRLLSYRDNVGLKPQCAG